MILVGPSGCGKSTALRMIAGLEDISDGELRIGGEVVNDRAPKDRDIAMVFQNYALYPHMTVRDNMGFALKLAKVDKAEIDQQGDRGGRDARPRPTTSTASRPTCPAASASAWPWAGRSCATRRSFLMDEPLSNLDAKLRVQMRTTIAALQQRLGTTTVYVTHDQTEAMTLGDRIAVMRAGRPAAGRHAAGALRRPGQPLRRRLHRLAGHELPARRARGRHGCSCRSARSSSTRTTSGACRPPAAAAATSSSACGPEDFEDAAARRRQAGGGVTLHRPRRRARVDGLRVLRVLRRRVRARVLRPARRSSPPTPARPTAGGDSDPGRGPARRRQRTSRRARTSSSGTTRRRSTCSSPSPAAASCTSARRPTRPPRPRRPRGRAAPASLHAAGVAAELAAGRPRCGGRARRSASGWRRARCRRRARRVAMPAAPGDLV